MASHKTNSSYEIMVSKLRRMMYYETYEIFYVTSFFFRDYSLPSINSFKQREHIHGKNQSAFLSLRQDKGCVKRYSWCDVEGQGRGLYLMWTARFHTLALCSMGNIYTR